jgi:hypothetical protein
LATASANSPTFGNGDDKVISPVAVAAADAISPTIRIDQAPPPVIIASGSAGVGGGGGGIPVGGFLDYDEDEVKIFIKARPSLALAFMYAPSLVTIDDLYTEGYNEDEDEELVVLALSQFGLL